MAKIQIKISIHTVYPRSRVNAESCLSTYRMYTSKLVKQSVDWPKSRNTQKLKALELRIEKLESKMLEKEAEAEVNSQPVKNKLNWSKLANAKKEAWKVVETQRKKSESMHFILEKISHFLLAFSILLTFYIYFL